MASQIIIIVIMINITCRHQVVACSWFLAFSSGDQENLSSNDDDDDDDGGDNDDKGNDHDDEKNDTNKKWTFFPSSLSICKK